MVRGMPWAVVLALDLIVAGCQPAPAVRHLSRVRPGFVHRLRMVDARTGWADDARHVLWTDDGGTTWLDATPPGISHPVQPPGLTSAALNARTAWVAAPNGHGVTVFRTADGGLTWAAAAEITTDLPNAQVLDFVDGKRGWLMMSNLGFTTGQDVAVQVFRTTDGGATWSLVAASGRQLPAAGFKTGLAFADAGTGWMTGSAPARGTPWLYVTHDGGATWRPQRLPVPPDFRSATLTTEPPTFFSSREGAFEMTATQGRACSAVIYSTTDGGVTWQPSAEVRPLADDVQSVAFFLDPRHGWVTDGDRMFATTDGGHSWHVLARLTQVSHGAVALDFVSPKDGWASFGAGLFRTENGGRTWDRLSTSPFPVTGAMLETSRTAAQ